MQKKIRAISKNYLKICLRHLPAWKASFTLLPCDLPPIPGSFEIAWCYQQFPGGAA